MKVLAAVIVLLALAGSAQGAAQTQTVAQFERGYANAFAHKQWGDVYDTLHPAQRQLIAYGDFFKCAVGAEVVAKAFGYDLSSVRFVRARVVRQKQLTLPETRVRVLATVVRVSDSMLAGGKRVTESHLEYVVKHNGQWRWIEMETKPSAYKNHSCGIK